MSVDRRGSLFNDPREVLEEEFRRPGTYFSLLEELALRERGMDDLTSALGMPHSALGAARARRRAFATKSPLKI